MARFTGPDPELDLDQLMELMNGEHPPVGDPDGEPISKWASDESRREAWVRHRDREPLRTQRQRERERGDLLWAEARYG